MELACISLFKIQEIDVIDFNGNYSRNVLLRLIALLGIAVILVALNHELFSQVYLTNQLTNIGLVINSTIFGLFLLGLAKIMRGFYLRKNV